MTRVLVAEDSTTVRELLIEILRSDPEIEVVGEAKNGLEAVELTKQLRPDLVTMDIRMPVMDGFEATKRIMIEAPTPIIIVSASVDVREIEISMHALRVGALSVLAKPTGPGSPDFDDLARRFVATVKAMAEVKVVRRWNQNEKLQAAGPAPAERRAQVKIVAMAASTGGPAALCQVLSDLPRSFPAPILVVQHIADGFAPGFASWLNSNLAIPTKVAEPNDPLSPSTIYIAPDGRHLGVKDRNSVMLSNAPPIGGFRPSASFLFESVAEAFGTSALAVVLTGMGQDGLEGVRAMRRAGGQVFVQDEKSSVVFGMPGAVVGAGLADAVLPLDAIAMRIVRSVRGNEGGSAT